MYAAKDITHRNVGARLGSIAFSFNMYFLSVKQEIHFCYHKMGVRNVDMMF